MSRLRRYSDMTWWGPYVGGQSAARRNAYNEAAYNL